MKGTGVSDQTYDSAVVPGSVRLSPTAYCFTLVSFRFLFVLSLRSFTTFT